MITEDLFFTCPLCDKTIGGWDKNNNVVWCDDESCALFEEVSINLWIAIHERLQDGKKHIQKSNL